jgi:hypothetical protein
MEKTYINANDLATILGTYKSTIYYIMHPEKKMQVAQKKATKENRETNIESRSLNVDFIKYNNSIKIDIDEFLEEHKISKNFQFVGKSFLDRMLIDTDMTTLPDYLTTKQVKAVTSLSNYKIIKLRDLIDTKIEINLNYPPSSKGRFQYLYNKNELIHYLQCNGMQLNSEKKIKFTKQFFTAKEVVDYLKINYGINKSVSTIYRRIIITKEIPAIRFGYMLKIPILEFTMLDLHSIFGT